MYITSVSGVFPLWMKLWNSLAGTENDINNLDTLQYIAVQYSTVHSLNTCGGIHLNYSTLL